MLSTRCRAGWRLAALGSALASGAIRFTLNPRHRRDATTKAAWLQGVCRRIMKVMAIRPIETGVCSPGALIACNHLSYLDIVVLSALAPVVFVAKKEVRAWPIFGWFAEKAGTRFIDRGRRGDVIRIATDLTPLIERGISVVVFLEGTSTDGRTVLPFKSSLLEPAVHAKWPAAAAALTYSVPSPRSAELEVCWWGDMTLTPHLVNLATLPWIEVRVAWDEAETGGGDRKALAELLRARVLSLKGGLASLRSPGRE